MIAEFLERLTRRKTEVARATAGIWQQLVIAVEAGEKIDPDGALDQLERLGKTPDDLAKAVALLVQRRELATLVAAGTTAEVAHPKIVKAIEAEVATFAKIEEAHEQRLRPMHGEERAAIFQMSEGARAKRELIVTATDPIRRAAVRDADEKLTALRQERSGFDREFRGKEDRLRELSVQEDRDLAGHVQRLTSEIEEMQSQRSSFDERAEQLNSECETARAKLLLPEAI